LKDSNFVSVNDPSLPSPPFFFEKTIDFITEITMKNLCKDKIMTGYLSKESSCETKGISVFE